jgi:soluble lytic murein transglycosylase-like protein
MAQLIRSENSLGFSKEFPMKIVPSSIHSVMRAGLICCTSLASAWCQPAGSADFIARQRASVSAMQDSIALQRASVQKQQTAAVGPAVAHDRDCAPLASSEVERLIGNASRAEDLDPDLLRSVMRQESGFKPCAVSPKGAIGLMQLMPTTAGDFNIRDPFDPVKNVDVGAHLLKQLIVRYGGDLARALGAYNAGPAVVDSSGGVPPIPETLDYVKQILSRLPAKRDDN